MWKIMPTSLPTNSIDIVLLIFHHHENFSSVVIKKIKAKVQYVLRKGTVLICYCSLREKDRM